MAQRPGRSAAKRMRGEEVLTQIEELDSSFSSDSESSVDDDEPETSDDNSDDNSGSLDDCTAEDDEDESASDDPEQWQKIGTGTNGFVQLPFTTVGTGFQLVGADLLENELSFFHLFPTSELLTEITDNTNQYSRTKLAATRKSVKWWRKTFFWLIEVSVVNSFIPHDISQSATGENS